MVNFHPPPSISGSIWCHVCPLEQRAGKEKNDVQEATVCVPVETKRLPVATIPTDAEDWSSEWGAGLWGSHLDGKAGCLHPKMAVLAWGTCASLPLFAQVLAISPSSQQSFKFTYLFTGHVDHLITSSITSVFPNAEKVQDLPGDMLALYYSLLLINCYWCT